MPKEYSRKRIEDIVNRAEEKPGVLGRLLIDLPQADKKTIWAAEDVFLDHYYEDGPSGWIIDAIESIERMEDIKAFYDFVNGNDFLAQVSFTGLRGLLLKQLMREEMGFKVLEYLIPDGINVNYLKSGKITDQMCDVALPLIYLDAFPSGNGYESSTGKRNLVQNVSIQALAAHSESNRLGERELLDIFNTATLVMEELLKVSGYTIGKSYFRIYKRCFDVFVKENDLENAYKVSEEALDIAWRLAERDPVKYAKQYLEAQIDNVELPLSEGEFYSSSGKALRNMQRLEKWLFEKEENNSKLSEGERGELLWLFADIYRKIGDRGIVIQQNGQGAVFEKNLDSNPKSILEKALELYIKSYEIEPYEIYLDGISETLLLLSSACPSWRDFIAEYIEDVREVLYHIKQDLGSSVVTYKRWVQKLIFFYTVLGIADSDNKEMRKAEKNFKRAFKLYLRYIKLLFSEKKAVFDVGIAMAVLTAAMTYVEHLLKSAPNEAKRQRLFEVFTDLEQCRKVFTHPNMGSKDQISLEAAEVLFRNSIKFLLHYKK